MLVVWARVQAGGESIEAALSLDAGASFPNSNNNINDALQRTFLPWASVDENGDFHVTWEVNQGGGAGVILHDALDRTTLADDANDQVTTVQITDFAAATSKIPAQPDRGLFSVSTVDVDRSTGRIYLSYTDRPNTTSNDTDIFVRFSDDNGANWSARTQVNDDETTTSQFMPRMAIDQTSGVVLVTWYDARNDVANNQQVDVFVSASFDEGLSWSPNQRVTEARSDEFTANPQRDLNNYAEYFGLTAHDDVIVVAWTDARAANFTAGTNEDVYTATVAVSIDHFLLYAVDADGDELELILMLADQFESAIHKVDEVERLGNPVDKDGEGISDADTHLVAYEIDDGDPEHEKRLLRVTNQFGELSLETDDPEWLLVPSLKSLDGPIPDDILPDPFPVDHFKCYEVELSKGAKFNRIEVPLQDQFMQEPRQFVVLKPAHLCNPVDKQGEGIENEDGHLVCYGLGRVRHKSVRNIHVNNQFGPLELETEWERELCVPSTKEILGFVDDDDDNHDDDRR